MVITNLTAIAIALRYDAESNRALVPRERRGKDQGIASRGSVGGNRCRQIALETTEIGEIPWSSIRPLQNWRWFIGSEMGKGGSNNFV